MKGKDVAIIFDGTTRDGEALVVLVRFVESWIIKQRLVRLRLLKSSVNGDELARIIIEVLHRKINIQENSLLAAMRDRASVNTKALQTVSVLYPDMIDWMYFTFPEQSGREMPHTNTQAIYGNMESHIQHQY